MEILEPWFATSNSRFVDELNRELPSGHILNAVELSTVAHRKDCDDVLYAFNDGTGRVAVVHLTYCKTRETNPAVPKTRIFESLEFWLEYMQAAHAALVDEDSDGQLWLRAQKLLGAAQKN
ncbi:MAG TPA: hypothetical protein VGF01_09145 [Terracidiphilus sp.]|jgi:hypothetical protein